SDVESKARLAIFGRELGIRNKDFPNRIREPHGHWLGFGEPAGIVVQLCQAEYVHGHLRDCGFSIFDIHSERDLNLRNVLGAKPRVEAGTVQVPGSVVKLKQGAAKHGHRTVPKQSRTVTVLPNADSHEFDSRRTGFPVASEFLSAYGGPRM